MRRSPGPRGGGRGGGAAMCIITLFPLFSVFWFCFQGLFFFSFWFPVLMFEFFQLWYILGNGKNSK